MNTLRDLTFLDIVLAKKFGGVSGGGGGEQTAGVKFTSNASGYIPFVPKGKASSMLNFNEMFTSNAKEYVEV